MNLRRGAVFLSLAAALPLLAAGRPDRATNVSAARAATVEMRNNLTFSPETVRIAAGGTVEWRNTSDLVHTVTANPDQAVYATQVRLPPGTAPFDSGRLEPNATFSRTFSVPGTYRYFCLPHEAAGMIGRLETVSGGPCNSSGTVLLPAARGVRSPAESCSGPRF